MEKNLIPYQDLFASESTVLAQRIMNLKANANVPKLLEKSSQRTNDISHCGFSLINTFSSNIKQDDISERDKFNYDNYNIDNFINEGKSNKNAHYLFNIYMKNNNHKQKNINSNEDNIIEDNLNAYYNKYTNNNNENNDNNLLRNNKLKLIPIKIPSSNAANNKENIITINNKYNNNNDSSNKKNLVKKNLFLDSNNQLCTENQPYQAALNELNTKDTGDSRAGMESSYLNSSMLSDSNLNNESNQNETFKINSIHETKEKINKYSQKHLMSHEDYLRNYLKSNLLHQRDGTQPKKESIKAESDFKSLYKSPEILQKADLVATSSKYEPQIITKEKIENYYINTNFSLKQPSNKNKKEAESANKIKLRLVSNSNKDVNTITSLVEKSYLEPRNQEDYENFEVNKNHKKNSAALNFHSGSRSRKFEHQHKSKFKHHDEQDQEEKECIKKDVHHNIYDDNKENFRSADNVKYLFNNLPISIENRTCLINRNTNLQSSDNNNNANENKNNFEGQAVNNEISPHCVAAHHHQNKKDNHHFNLKPHSFSFINNNATQEKGKKGRFEIQENLFVNVSESQSDLENKINYTAQKLKFKLNRNKQSSTLITESEESSVEKQNQIIIQSKKDKKKIVANLILDKEANSSENKNKNININRIDSNKNINYNHKICENEINTKLETNIQDIFHKNCRDCKRLECWEEVSFPKQLSERIKLKLLCNSNETSKDLIESNVSNLSSEFEDKKPKGNLSKKRSNTTSSNKDADKSDKRGVCIKSQFENFYREVLSKENNKALIIYDVFSEKNDFGYLVECCYYSDDSKKADRNDNNIDYFVNVSSDLNNAAAAAAAANESSISSSQRIINNNQTNAADGAVKDFNCLSKHSNSFDLKMS